MPDSHSGGRSHSPLNPSRGELPILQATTDLIQWFAPLLNGLPRDQTFARRQGHASRLLVAVPRQRSGWLHQQQRRQPA